MMKYPKKIMRKSELIKLGFPEALLDRAYRHRGQTFAMKLNPLKTNSVIVFDTEGFEEWRLEQIKLEQKSMQMKRGVM